MYEDVMNMEAIKGLRAVIRFDSQRARIASMDVLQTKPMEAFSFHRDTTGGGAIMATEAEVAKLADAKIKGIRYAIFDGQEWTRPQVLSTKAKRRGRMGL